ncbi:MAG: TIGR03618 family F420-dependent PPOX class oxidoreductase [Chloroflexi bacterium]|nr:TIGR03618 family F420-dependent PPOX class oxidoreductase [Chloroflexota bacterium]
MPRRMTPEEIERFLQGRRLAVLITRSDDGMPVPTPIWYVSRDGRFYMRTGGTSVKVGNIHRDPRVVISVQEEWPPYRAVIVQGRATIEPERPVLAVALARRYLGIIGGFFYLRGQRDDIEQGEEVTVVVEPEKIISWDYSPETPWVGRLWLWFQRLLPLGL